MIGALTVGKKAAKFGYKKYGVPGAILAGAGGVAGLVVAKKGFKRLTQSAIEGDTPRLESGESSSSSGDADADSDA
ncbi:hypothetical protein [Saliphagus infecundisoli]|uniref:Uncharacterized protein n=1 Tax=Saliphagus infecundisoli TaxID=1849069 RepID=A0ABD5QHS6_9EURY|nr:hypothetical protein [Saliphagus infecundisoli]